jgi:hypothetical protein
VFTPAPCGRCWAIVAGTVTWFCWWCGGALCDGCGDRYGHCGHPEADAVNEAAARAESYDDRARIVALLNGAGFDITRVRGVLGLPPSRPSGKPN